VIDTTSTHKMMLSQPQLIIDEVETVVVRFASPGRDEFRPPGAASRTRRRLGVMAECLRRSSARRRRDVVRRAGRTGRDGCHTVAVVDGRFGPKAAPLHRPPVLSTAGVLHHSLEAPPHGELAVSEWLEHGPHEQPQPIRDALVALETQLLQAQ